MVLAEGLGGGVPAREQKTNLNLACPHLRARSPVPRAPHAFATGVGTMKWIEGQAHLSRMVKVLALLLSAVLAYLLFTGLLPTYKDGPCKQPSTPSHQAVWHLYR